MISTATLRNQHSLTTNLLAFTYADGVNNVLINGTDSGLTDLDMFYFKVVHPMVMLLVDQFPTILHLMILNQV